MIRYLRVSEDITTNAYGLTPVCKKEDCSLIVDTLYCEDSMVQDDSPLFDEMEEGQVKTVLLPDNRYDIYVKGYVWFENDIRG